jgi:GAF domain-containing protein/ActR/RegA family two-component response regulator
MCRILIVDDNALDGHWIAEQLKARIDKGRLTVEQTISVEAARQKVRQVSPPYDILLVDDQLGPGLRGIELVEELSLSQPSLDFMVFTDGDEAETRTRAYTAGAFKHLAKPFDLDELIWSVKLLIEQRSIDYEREWLRLYTQILEETHQATSLRQLAEVLVQGSLRLGFKRARIFRIEKDGSGRRRLTGVCQAGHDEFADFERLSIPLAKDRYAQKIIAEQRITFFTGAELGPGYLGKSFKTARSPIASGEWVGMPLLNGEACAGILMMDNGNLARPLRTQQRVMLHLYARHAAIAYAHMLRHEEERRHEYVAEVIKRVMEQMGDATQPNSLDRLFAAIEREFRMVALSANFIVVLKGDSPNWLYTRHHHENGVVRQPYWRHGSQKSITAHLVEYEQPLFLPQGTEEYRRKHNLIQAGARSACSWMGVPLRAGGQVIGAMILEDDEKRGAYTLEHYSLFVALADQLSSIVQVAWLHEKQHEFIQKLTLVHQASEQLVLLAEQREAWLWHVTLTVITAEYGFGFDRAALFLVEEGSKRLYGCMGIGHFQWQRAEKDWAKDQRQAMSFELYLRRLIADELPKTDVEEFIVGKSFESGPADGAFAAVLGGQGVQMVAAEEADRVLPKWFVDRFGSTDYILVPLQVGERIIGLVSLDNYWAKDPHQLGALETIDRLTNQVATIYENLRISRAQTELIDEGYPILTDQGPSSLKSALEELCRRIKRDMQADVVALYPLREINPDDYVYDLQNACLLGLESDFWPDAEFGPDSFSAYILKYGTLALNDVSNYEGTFANIKLAQHRFIVAEKLRAFIAIPIQGLQHPNKVRAILYINYRQPKNFRAQDLRLAKSYARYAALIIRHTREVGVWRSATNQHGAELKLLGHLLEFAIKSEFDEEQFIAELLHTMRKLLNELWVDCILTLVAWKPPALAEGEPAQYRINYYLTSGSGTIDRQTSDATYRGISGRALQTGETQYAPDVNSAEWSDVWWDRGVGTQAEMDVPIKTQDGRVLGALTVEVFQPDQLTERHKGILERLAAVAALALDNIRRQQKMQTIFMAAASMTQPPGLEETLAKIVEAARTAAPDLSMLTLWHNSPLNGELTLGAYFGAHDTQALLQEVPRENGLLRKVMDGTRAIWAPNFMGRRLFSESEFVKREALVSTVAFPLLADANPVGAMFFSYRRHHEFTAEERVLFPIFAQIAAASIQDAILLERANRERKRHETDIAIAETIGGALELEETFRRFLHHLIGLYPEASPCILIADEANEVLNFAPAVREFYRIDDPVYAQLDRVPWDRSSFVGALAVQSQRWGRKLMMNVADVNHPHLGFKEQPGGKTVPFPVGEEPIYMRLLNDTTSQFSITLYSEKYHKVLGALALERRGSRQFDLDDERTIWGIAKHIRFVLERDIQNAMLRRKDWIASRSGASSDFVHRFSGNILRLHYKIASLRAGRELPSDAGQDLNELQQVLGQMRNAMLPESPWGFAVDESRPLESWLYTTVMEVVNHCDYPITVVTDFQTADLLCQDQWNELPYVIRDLTENAVEAMKASAVREIYLRTQIVIVGEEEWVELQIEDTGSGIPDARIRQLLLSVPYSSKKGAGHGNGLIFARDRIERMNGTIRLLPYQPTKGAVFAIRLPLGD